jgi:hypothetical protein
MLTPRVIKDVHDQQVRELEMRARACDNQVDCSGGLRQTVGRALIQIGVGLAAECPPQLAARR